jgi:hypothetical protein
MTSNLAHVHAVGMSPFCTPSVKGSLTANPKELSNHLPVSDRILGEHKYSSQALRR